MTTKQDINHPAKLRLVAQHTPLVNKIARSMAHSLPPHVMTDDLVQDGLLGLIDAIIRTTRETSGAEFEYYLAKRTRGAMLDGLRAMDHGARQVRHGMRQVEAAIQQLGHLMGRPPTEGEVAKAIGVPLEEYRHLLQQAHGYRLVSLEDLEENATLHGYLEQCADSDSDPLALLERAGFRKALANSLRTLSKQTQELLNLYYVEEQKMREIGLHMGLSEARVSQLHASAIASLRAHMLDEEQTRELLQPRRTVR
jgi:RNA polymerase sigma factor for flagellar operon FliA